MDGKYVEVVKLLGRGWVIMAGDSKTSCPICNQEAVALKVPDGLNIECKVCGTYIISGTAHAVLGNKEYSNRYILSGLTREATELGRSPLKILSTNLEDYLSESHEPSTLLEKIDLILLFILRHSKRAGDWVPVDHRKDYPIAFAKDSHEFQYMFHIACSMGYLENHGATNGVTDYLLTLPGWTRVEEIRRKDPKTGKQCFVAMWFDDQLGEAFLKGFDLGIREAGYDPVRIDMVEHNNQITDQIIIEIRKSRLVVADFTGHRGGVYYEAGFARGLGIPVIYTCRRDHFENRHFDIYQFNHVVWETPEDLKTKLRDRILATVPLNPVLTSGERV